MTSNRSRGRTKDSRPGLPLVIGLVAGIAAGIVVSHLRKPKRSPPPPPPCAPSSATLGDPAHSESFSASFQPQQLDLLVESLPNGFKDHVVDQVVHVVIQKPVQMHQEEEEQGVIRNAPVRMEKEEEQVVIQNEPIQMEKKEEEKLDVHMDKKEEEERVDIQMDVKEEEQQVVIQNELEQSEKKELVQLDEEEDEEKQGRLMAEKPLDSKDMIKVDAIPVKHLECELDAHDCSSDVEHADFKTNGVVVDIFSKALSGSDELKGDNQINEKRSGEIESNDETDELQSGNQIDEKRSGEIESKIDEIDGRNAKIAKDCELRQENEGEEVARKMKDATEAESLKKSNSEGTRNTQTYDVNFGDISRISERGLEAMLENDGTIGKEEEGETEDADKVEVAESSSGDIGHEVEEDSSSRSSPLSKDMASTEILDALKESTDQLVALSSDTDEIWQRDANPQNRNVSSGKLQSDSPLAILEDVPKDAESAIWGVSLPTLTVALNTSPQEENFVTESPQGKHDLQQGVSSHVAVVTSHHSPGKNEQVSPLVPSLEADTQKGSSVESSCLETETQKQNSVESCPEAESQNQTYVESRSVRKRGGKTSQDFGSDSFKYSSGFKREFLVSGGQPVETCGIAKPTKNELTERRSVQAFLPLELGAVCLLIGLLSIILWYMGSLTTPPPS